MQKGHLVLGLVVLVFMITLPAAAVVGQGGSPTVPLPPATAEDTITVLHADTGKVEAYTMQEYIFGVVAAEMPMSYPEQAIKAQAVAAYTLTLHRMNERAQNPPAALKGADMTDDSGTDQGFITRELAMAKWGDKGKEYAALLDQWIGEVLGQRVLYNGAPALTVYHSISGGRTESAQNVWGGSYPYLVPVESVGDLMSEGYIAEKTFTGEQVIAALATLDSSISSDSEITVGETTCSDSGTVLSVTLCGKSFTGRQVRSAFSLRSANFDVSAGEDGVTFTVRGHGHLVGMSQFGAKTMAQQGSTYDEILLWYYPGCTIANLG